MSDLPTTCSQGKSQPSEHLVPSKAPTDSDLITVGAGAPGGRRFVKDDLVRVYWTDRSTRFDAEWIARRA